MFLRTTVVLLAVFVDKVFTECSDGCISCRDQTCIGCESSFFLTSGFCSKCPEDCASCNSFDDCSSCKTNKYGLHARCVFNCIDSCLDMKCQDDTGYCTQCLPGRYGLQCPHNCSLCADGDCDSRKCSYGCRNGYYEYTTVETFCLQCPSDCRNCKDGKTCFECNDGFHLYKFKGNVHCVSCSQGPQCSDYCVIQDCNMCRIIDNSLVCTDCPEGQRFNGEICESNLSPCSKECSTYCDSNVICQGECNDGWTGERCSDKCFDKCTKCSKENGDICQQCKGDFYSTDCSLVCNPSCITEEGKNTCRLSDGYCLNGCIRSFWGETCNKTCPYGCKDVKCGRSSGQCEGDCKHGYTETKCIQTSTRVKKVTTTTTATTKVTTSVLYRRKDNNFIIGYFSGFGTSVIIVVIAVLIYFVRRRYLAGNVPRDNCRDIEIPTYYNTTTNRTAVHVQQASVDNNYESLRSSRVNDKEYCDLGTLQK